MPARSGGSRCLLAAHSARCPPAEWPARTTPPRSAGHESAGRLGDQSRQPVDRGGDVVERPWPAAARLSRPAIFRRTHDNSGSRKSLGERCQCALSRTRRARNRHAEIWSTGLARQSRLAPRRPRAGDGRRPRGRRRRRSAAPGQGAEPAWSARQSRVRSRRLADAHCSSDRHFRDARDALAKHDHYERNARAIPPATSVIRAASLCSNTWPPRRTDRTPDHACGNGTNPATRLAMAGLDDRRATVPVAMARAGRIAVSLVAGSFLASGFAIAPAFGVPRPADEFAVRAQRRPGGVGELARCNVASMPAGQRTRARARRRAQARPRAEPECVAQPDQLLQPERDQEPESVREQQPEPVEVESLKTPSPSPSRSRTRARRPSPSPSRSHKAGAICVTGQLVQHSSSTKPGGTVTYSIWVWSTVRASKVHVTASSSARSMKFPRYTLCPSAHGTRCTIGSLPANQAFELMITDQVRAAATAGAAITLTVNVDATSLSPAEASVTTVVSQQPPVGSSIPPAAAAAHHAAADPWRYDHAAQPRRPVPDGDADLVAVVQRQAASSGQGHQGCPDLVGTAT